MIIVINLIQFFYIHIFIVKTCYASCGNCGITVQYKLLSICFCYSIAFNQDLRPVYTVNSYLKTK